MDRHLGTHPEGHTDINWRIMCEALCGTLWHYVSRYARGMVTLTPLPLAFGLQSCISRTCVPNLNFLQLCTGHMYTGIITTERSRQVGGNVVSDECHKLTTEGLRERTE